MMLALEYGVPRASDQNKRPFNLIFFLPQKLQQHQSSLSTAAVALVLPSSLATTKVYLV
jgi:hypothetical protein